MKQVIKTKVGVRGQFRLQVYKAATMELVKDTGWFDNLILDQGLNRLGTAGSQGYCQVGTSSVAPSVGQTGLVAPIAYTLAIMEVLTFNDGSPDYEGWTSYRYRFDIGVAAGNLSEVGTGWGSGNDLFNRALIVDGGGTPTTITVLPDEVLDVTYKIGAFVDTADHNTNISIGGVMRTCVTRAMGLGTWITGTVRGRPGIAGMDEAAECKVFDGPIGPITGSPTGTGGGGVFGVPQAYSNNSLERKVDFTFGLLDGNILIESVSFEHSMGHFQTSFSPPLAKDNTKVLELTFQWTWDRH